MVRVSKTQQRKIEFILISEPAGLLRIIKQMENEFEQVMSQQTDQALITLLTVDRYKYQVLAIEAAELEVKKRYIDVSKFEQIRVHETTKKEKVDANIVGSGIRCLNFVIDSIVWLVIVSMISFVARLIIPPVVPRFTILILYTVMFGSYIAYYAIMEMKFQKTIGKFITKTKVVKLNGDRPTSGDIMGRTVFRWIPFDRISFLFMRHGIHDFLSKTTVVKDR